MTNPYERSALNVRTVRAPLVHQPKPTYTDPLPPDNRSDLSADRYAAQHSPGSYVDTESQASYSGYLPDTRYSFEDQSSVGSVTSYSPNNQILDVRKLPVDSNGRVIRVSTDSGVYIHNRRAQSIASSESSYYRETDLDSVMTGGSSVAPRTRNGAYSGPTDDRYHGELYKPTAAPRKTIEAKKMFGEVHPRILSASNIPVTDSENELDDQSSVASMSASERPVAAPRASMRMKKAQSNPGFIEDELDTKQSGAKGILKRPNTLPANMDSSYKEPGKKLIVRFQQVEKEHTNSKDLIDYNAIDSDTGSTKSKKNQDIWGHVKPVTKKPARNDPKRSSGSSNRGRQSRSNSSNGRQSRSSSHDRSRSGQRSSSKDRSSNRSSSKDRTSTSQRSSSRDRSSSVTAQSRERSKSQSSASEYRTATEDVKIEVTPDAKKHQSMMSEIIATTDKQKLCKWALIIGVPIVLLIAVGVVIGVIVGGGGG